jgi:hypothetical protein
LAEFISWATLEDGSIPSGIRFESRHGSNYECWAIWERVEPVLLHCVGEIPVANVYFQEILKAFRLESR